MKIFFATDPEITKKVRNELDNSFLNESLREIVYDYREVDDDLEGVGSLEDFSIVLSERRSTTLYAFKEFSQLRENAGIIIIDAHPNTRKEDVILDSRNYLKMMVDNGIVSPERIVLLGLRKYRKDEIQYLKDKNIRFFQMKQLFSQGPRDLCEAIMEFVVKWPSLYLSIDLDVLDPAFIPDIELKEPGGMSSRELIYIIQRFKKLKNLRIADISGISNRGYYTTKIIAKLIQELS
jgi:arginase family enzyme